MHVQFSSLSSNLLIRFIYRVLCRDLNALHSRCVLAFALRDVTLWLYSFRHCRSVASDSIASTPMKIISTDKLYTHLRYLVFSRVDMYVHCAVYFIVLHQKYMVLSVCFSHSRERETQRSRIVTTAKLIYICCLVCELLLLRDAVVFVCMCVCSR